MHDLFKLTLRTTDVDGARRFYAQVLGDAGDLDVVQLHEQALARGARPHWLGFVRVDDVDAAVAKLLGHGATVLAPKWVNPQGLEASVLRDAGGAVVALGRPPPNLAVHGPKVAFHLLNTAEAERAKRTWAELCGWAFSAPTELAGLTVHPFSWTAGGPVVGAFCDLAGRPEVHPHWTFALEVASLEPAMAAVRDGGGRVLPLGAGARVAICEDAQGAAFALQERT